MCFRTLNSCTPALLSSPSELPRSGKFGNSPAPVVKFFPPFYKSIIVLVTYVRQHRKRLQDALTTSLSSALEKTQSFPNDTCICIFMLNLH